MRRCILIFTLMMFATISVAQGVNEDAVKAMQKLAVMVGEWEGDGWAMTPDRTKKESHVDEKMQWKLDKTVILVEGLGKDKEGKVVHSALGLIFYDVENKKYGLRSHLNTGQKTDASFEVLGEGNFSWSFPTPNGGQMRYTINVDETKWHEIGEYSRDGQQWFNTFEMNLVRKK